MQFFIVPFFIAFALTLWGRNRYRKIYGQEVEFTLPSKITGAELVERILKNYGIEDVSVVKGRGVLEDFYAPEKKRVSLAPHHYDGINSLRLHSLLTRLEKRSNITKDTALSFGAQQRSDGPFTSAFLCSSLPL